MKNLESWKKLLFCFFFSILGVTNAFAFSTPSYYYAYRTNLTVSPTGNGSVYASYTSNDFVSDHDRDETATTTSKSYDAVIYSKSNAITMNLHADAAEGYRFVKWVDSKNNTVGEGSSPSVSLVYTPGTADYDWISTGWFSGYRVYKKFQEFNYTAIFRAAGSLNVKVADENKTVGSAYIKEESYEEGDEVTLVATNAGGSELSGWAFDYWELNGQKVSESEELKVTVPTESVTYIAHFIKASDEYYCFIRNKGTGKYLKLSKVINNYSVTINEREETFTSNFNGAFTLVSEDATTPPISDPGCVFIVSGFESGATGVKNATLISQAIPFGNAKGSKIITRPISINPVSSGVFTISTPYYYSGDGKDHDCYFRDNGGTFDVHPALAGENSQWEIITLNNANIGSKYFGLTPNSKMKKEGKYYTTFYTTFPYQLKGEGMKAYYIDENSVQEKGDSYVVECKEIEGDIVPAWFPVIIECGGATAEANKILPLMPTSTKPESLVGVTNHLMGYIKVQNGEKAGNGKMFVLSVGTNTGLGLYKLKTGTAMADNKVYVELEDENTLNAKSVTFDFGTTNAIKEVAEPEIVSKQGVYDLQGRRVSNPSSGIYIVNGKKIVIK